MPKQRDRVEEIVSSTVKTKNKNKSKIIIKKETKNSNFKSRIQKTDDACFMICELRLSL